MNLAHYPYVISSSYLEYEFYSNGPKGRIKKIVRFEKIQNEPVVYNLGFGDENPQTGLVDDLTTTDNKDTNIVLATVANVINEFIKYNGNHFIYAKGSTAGRTRLYQIGLSGIIDNISTDFIVYGLKDDVIYPFQKEVNYDAFLVKRK